MSSSRDQTDGGGSQVISCVVADNNTIGAIGFKRAQQVLKVLLGATVGVTEVIISKKDAIGNMCNAASLFIQCCLLENQIFQSGKDRFGEEIFTWERHVATGNPEIDSRKVAVFHEECLHKYTSAWIFLEVQGRDRAWTEDGQRAVLKYLKDNASKLCLNQKDIDSGLAILQYSFEKCRARMR